MTLLTREQFSDLLGALDQRRSALSAAVGDEQAHAAERTYGAIAGGVTDAGDAAVADVIADLDAAQVDRQVAELRAIDAALARIREGTYGACIECGSAIPYSRLKVAPAASRCLACQERLEHTHAHPETPRL